MKTMLSLIALCLGIAAPDAYGGEIYDNGNPSAGNNALPSDFDFPQQIADDFVLPAGSGVVTDVHFYGAYSFLNTPTEPDDFTIRFFADAAGLPAINPLVSYNVGNPGRTDTLLNDFNSGDIFVYNVVIPATVLPTGNTLWLSVVNNTVADTDDEWFWTFSGTGPSVYRVADGETWSSDSGFGNFHFQLTDDATNGVVPEPSTFALAGLGLLGLSFVALRKKFRRA